MLDFSFFVFFKLVFTSLLTFLDQICKCYLQ